MLAWHLSQKSFLASRLAFMLCSPLNMYSSVSLAWLIDFTLERHEFQNRFSRLWESFTNIKIHCTKSNNLPHLKFDVSCQEFYRHLFYDGGRWGKCLASTFHLIARLAMDETDTTKHIVASQFIEITTLKSTINTHL